MTEIYVNKAQMEKTASMARQGLEKSRGRPRSADKNRAILDAASALFLSVGFDRVSMDQIASKAEVSKQTVYGHFKSKEGLFRAVIGHRVSDFFQDDLLDTAGHRSIKETLNRLGQQYMRLILSDDAVAMFRILAGNAESHPKLVAMFFEEGPGRLAQALESVFRYAHERGDLICADAQKASQLFATLLRGDLYLKRTLGLASGIEADEINRHVADVVSTFLKLYPPQEG
ncbi:TetR family transcriptional regulator [Iodidimonas muriae]|uniref:TetR family transcriptional regulator n=2 Tax=Iodidimonas muriae TaxID=261467 RepID=A0ABQ2LC22_9PROT|nr:TetR family transcriptional regulator [Kordiimonadales bacterium JCM 17843]GGO09962.1 TetR family transcriptional regulator [Iodidimonas muriae]